MRRIWNGFQIACSMYSRLPAAQCEWSEENMKYVMCFFPWIGIVIGALCFGWELLAQAVGMSPPLRTVVLMVIPIAVSGGIHLDGLLDTADAMSSWRTRERRLEILKDSHAGAFAIIACAVYFFLMYAALDSLHGRWMWCYVFVFVISRSLSAISVVTFPKASASGTVAGFSKSAQTRVIQITGACYLAVCTGLLFCLFPVGAAASVVIAGVTFFWYGRMAMKHFGGINGDLAGCFVSVCELTVPLVLAFLSYLV